jgi:hypothetical protein
MKTNKLLYGKIFLITLVASLIVLGGCRFFGYSWEKTFGGIWGKEVQQTIDGGYIIVGTYNWLDTSGLEGLDVLLIKTDADGDELWSKTFGGSKWDEGSSVSQTNDEGYILVGGTESFGPGYVGVYLIKTDADGNEQWSKTFGGSSFDTGSSVQQTKDGGFIIAGISHSFSGSYSEVYLIKTDADGNELWSETYYSGSAGDCEGNSVQQTIEGGYIIVGTRGGGFEVYLIKTDADGNELWSKTFNGIRYARGKSVQQTVDGGYIIAGRTSPSYADEEDVYLIKTDADGNEVWSKTFGGAGRDFGSSVQQTKDGGFIIGGSTQSFGAGESDVYLIKTDANGNEMWSETFGGNRIDRGNSVQQTVNGGYIIAGDTRSFELEDTGGVYLIYYSEFGSKPHDKGKKNN